MGRAGRESMRLLVLAAILLAPTSLAQVPGGPLEPPQLTIFVNDPGGTGVVPGTIAILDLVVTYNPPQSARPAPTPSAERPEDMQPTRITLAVASMPSWFDNVTFVPPELLVRMDGPQVSGSRTLNVRAYANISPHAPANDRQGFVVTATAEPNGAIKGQTAASPDDFRIRARIIGDLNVTAEPSLIVPGGRWTTIPVTVRNDGNSPIVAKINVTVRPENSQVEFLGTLQLADNETKVIDVRLRVPWTNAEFGILEVEAVPIVDGEEGDAARAEIAVRGESAVPFPTPLLVLAMLGALAFRPRR